MTVDYENPSFAVTAMPDSTFVSNVELALSQGHVAAEHARKVCEISARGLWYPNLATIVLPEQPNADFRDYVATFGREPEVVVPTGVDPNRLSMRDGFGDCAFQDAVGGGAVVESYAADEALFHVVEDQGGIYVGGNPRQTPIDVNNKAHFSFLTAGIVAPPPGECHSGLDDIAAAVQSRLNQERRAFVRHTQSAAGFGNVAFTANGTVPSLTEIKKQLTNHHPNMWANGTALVERYLTIAQLLGVSFNQGRFTYDNVQLTHDGEYVGCVSPIPPELELPGQTLAVIPETYAKIGNSIARSVFRRSGYSLNGNADLGITCAGKGVGFEINGRMTGSRHAIAIGELVFGVPWSTWREAGHVIHSVDKFVLRRTMDFAALHGILDAEDLLASKQNPHGVIISIPPHEDVAGIHVQSASYEDAEAIFKEVEAAVGHPTANRPDYPLTKGASVKT